MIATDASIWVSSFVNDKFHHTTVTWIKNIATTGEDLAAPNLLLAEVAGAVARQTGRVRLAHRALERLKAFRFLRIYPVDEPMAMIAAELAANCALRGADAVYAALAFELDVPLVTWDVEQMTRVQRVIKSGTPGNI